MKHFLFLMLAVFLSTGLAAQVITCYDVQYTTAASGNSPMIDQIVTVQGIVVAQKFYTGTSATNYGFIISDPAGGPWSGLLVFTNQYHPQRGDLVQVTGKIVEYFNLTEMSPTTGYQVLSQGNPLPQPSVIKTSQLISAATAEQWESVLVRVQDVTVTSTPNSYSEFNVNDGSGACQVDDQCFPRTGFSWPPINVGQSWSRIQGVVDFSFSFYAINPRDLQDMVQVDNVSNASVGIQTTTGIINELVAVNVLTSRIKPVWGVSSYTAVFKIDPSKVLFHEVDMVETMTSHEPDVQVSLEGDLITVTFQSQEPINSAADDMTLIKLILEPITYGEAVIQIQSFVYDTTPILSLTSGKILTAIRRSIAWLNITNAHNGKNIFNPALNEKITIEYGTKSISTGVNAKAIVRIYDAQGRLVSTPVNKNIGNALGIESFVWDGRDTNMKLLPIGMYYCHLEIIQRASGAKEETVQPIVIKSIMK
ncbi:MAG: hypothetical protein Q8M98_03555 [Candidatus Cloacimonadaceae bacterium]|nr:hypothetical protein [Candidatus Cloacimonadaceae bacterium]